MTVAEVLRSAGVEQSPAEQDIGALLLDRLLSYQNPIRESLQHVGRVVGVRFVPASTYTPEGVLVRLSCLRMYVPLARCTEVPEREAHHSSR